MNITNPWSISEGFMLPHVTNRLPRAGGNSKEEHIAPPQGSHDVLPGNLEVQILEERPQEGIESEASELGVVGQATVTSSQTSESYDRMSNIASTNCCLDGRLRSNGFGYNAGQATLQHAMPRDPVAFGGTIKAVMPLAYDGTPQC
jgi:hypothetical protein